MKRRLLFIICFSAYTMCKAGVHQTDNNSNGWYMYYGNHRLTNKWGIHTEYQWRRNNILENWQQSLLRVGVDYRLNEQVMFTLGYGNIITFPYGKQPTLKTYNEHRIWQNILLTHKIGRLSILHRYRPEERFYEKYTTNPNHEIILDKIIYTNRMRYMLSVSLPINKLKIEKGTIFIRVYDETFVNFGKNVQYNIFDQNRFYCALGYQVLNNMNVQAGYLNQRVFKTDGIHIENNNTLQIGLTYNIDFRKSEQ